VKNKIVVYDFDKTLTKRDTLLGFFLYAAAKDISFYFRGLVYINYMFFSKFGMMSNARLKSNGIKLFLSHLDKQELAEKLQTYHLQIAFNHVFESIVYDKNTTYYIITASFQEYVSPIFPSFVRVIGSTIKYTNGRASDLAYNCYKENKRKMMDGNYIDTLYTDSYSDFALAELAKEIRIVNKNKVIVCQGIDDFIKYFGE
tara:strand:+ start:3233 stop:3835 length:603 start_codon:yes stop_codon:yes gene_type:complete